MFKYTCAATNTNTSIKNLLKFLKPPKNGELSAKLDYFIIYFYFAKEYWSIKLEVRLKHIIHLIIPDKLLIQSLA